MKIDATGAIGDGDIRGSLANGKNGFARIDVIRPGAGKNFDGCGIRRSLKIEPINARSDLFASRVLNASACQETESKQSDNSAGSERG